MFYNVTGTRFIHHAVVLCLSGRRLFGSDRLDPSGKYVENSTKFFCLTITGYRIKYVQYSVMASRTSNQA